MEAVRRGEPIAVELVNLPDIGEWITRVESEKPDSAAVFHLTVRSLSHKFPTAVAADPTMLDHLEWRDLERMMARVMEGLGFKVTAEKEQSRGIETHPCRCGIHPAVVHTLYVAFARHCFSPPPTGIGPAI